MVTGKWAFIYLTPVLRICCNFFVYSERCASQLVMIYWLCQRNNSHMVKPKTLNIYVHVIMQSHCEPLFITHWWYGFVVTLFVCLFVRTYDLDILPLNYYAHVIKESHRPHLRISSERSIPLPLNDGGHIPRD